MKKRYSDMPYKILAVDFDGTLADYRGWQGLGNFGSVLPGAKEELEKLKALGWTITVWTTRGADINQVESYLIKNQIPFDYINENPPWVPANLSEKKIIADVYLDDRGYTFRGSWANLAQAIDKFQPWYREDNSTVWHSVSVMNKELRQKIHQFMIRKLGRWVI